MRQSWLNPNIVGNGVLWIAGFAMQISGWVNQTIAILLLIGAFLWSVISLVFWSRNKQRKPTTYALGHPQYRLSVAGVPVTIDNIEESLENVSITGTVDKRQSAAVLNKRRLPLDLPLKERLQKYAEALVEADLNRRKQNDRTAY